MLFKATLYIQGITEAWYSTHRKCRYYSVWPKKMTCKSECLQFSVSLCISVEEFVVTPVGGDK